MEDSNTTRPDNVIWAHVPAWDIYAVIKAKEAKNKEPEHAETAGTESADLPEAEHAAGAETEALDLPEAELTETAGTETPEIQVADAARVAGVGVEIGQRAVGGASDAELAASQQALIRRILYGP